MAQFPFHLHPTVAWGKSLNLYNLLWALDQDFNLHVSQVFFCVKQYYGSRCWPGAGEGEDRSVFTWGLLMCEITAASEEISWTGPQTSPALLRGLDHRPQSALPTSSVL